MSKVDLRAFPNQTAVSFWIIVLVMLGVMIAGAVGPSPILMWPTTLTMLILPVRALLAWPDRELKKRQDQVGTDLLTQDGTLLRLQDALDILANANGCPRIKIIISGSHANLHAIGSWRRHYLFVGQEIARQLDNDLQNPEREAIARSALLHEIAHFFHRDVQRVGYTRELLGSSFWLILWWMVFLLGWLGFANLAGRAYLAFDINQVTGADPLMAELLAPIVTLSPETRAEMTEKVESINMGLVLNYIVQAFTPIIWMGFFLWLFFWRRMLRVQEHYADHFVLTVTDDPASLRAAWLDCTPTSLIASSLLPQWRVRVQKTWRSFLFRVSDRLPEKLLVSLRVARQLFDYHPNYDERVVFILNPMAIYQSWNAVTVQILALVLALEIVSTTPLIGYHLGSTYVIHFTTVAVFVMLAFWVLPLVIQQKAVKSDLVKSLSLVYGVRLGWITLTFAFLLFLASTMPEFTQGLLNAIVFSGSRFAGNPTSVPVDDPMAMALSIIPSYYGLQILSLLAAAVLLWVYIRLIRQAVEAGTAVNWHKYHRNLIIALSLAALSLLTPLSDLIQGNFDNLLTPLRLLGYAVGLGSVLWLVIWDRRTA